MIFYGDPRFEASPDALLDSLHHCAVTTDANDADGIRALLIRAGQFEQAISDFDSSPSAIATAERITDIAAAAFHAGSAPSQPELPQARFSTGDALVQLRLILQSAYQFPCAQLFALMRLQGMDLSTRASKARRLITVPI